MKTVNFIEAVNSGKRFRPVGGGQWKDPYQTSLGQSPLPLKYINCEFELEEKTISITESDLENALIRVKHEYEDVFAINQKALMTELGF